MIKAKMYLDFDGVFNAPKPPYNDVTTISVTVKDSKHIAENSVITFSPSVINRIERLLQEHDVELVWLTSWNDDNQILNVARLMSGFPEGRVIQANLNHAAENSHDWTLWKAEAILEDQKTYNTPFVWVDDNAPRYHESRVIEELTHTPVSYTH